MDVFSIFTIAAIIKLHEDANTQMSGKAPNIESDTPRLLNR
jgi:hypothetical protein